MKMSYFSKYLLNPFCKRWRNTKILNLFANEIIVLDLALADNLLARNAHDSVR